MEAIAFYGMVMERRQSKNAGKDQAMQQIEVTPTPKYGGGVIGGSGVGLAACHNVVPSIQCHDGRAATT